MTLHFLSFIFDMTSWLLFGALYGRYIQILNKNTVKYNNIVSVKVALIALAGGLIATGDRALPNYGFALYHFFVATFFAFIYSFKYMVSLRKYTYRELKMFLKLFTPRNFKKLYVSIRKIQSINLDNPINL